MMPTPPPVLQQDKLIVVDLEATCWKGPPPPGEENEIIEIGVCVLDINTGTPSDKRSLLVKPTRSQVSPFCTELTSITPEMAAAGMTFAAACAILEADYATQTHLWGSWGDYDKKMFQKQCQAFDVAYPFSSRHVNLKKLFGKLASERKQVGMMRALKMLEITPEGTHHRGDDDAWNVARITGHLLKLHGPGFLASYW